MATILSSANASETTVQLTEKGYRLYEQEQYSEALECYTKALEKAKQGNDYKNTIICLGNIGNIFAIFGDYEQSAHYNQLGYELASERKDFHMQKHFACMLVEVYCNGEDLRKAETYYRKLRTLPMPLTKEERFHGYTCQALIAKTKKQYMQAAFYYKAALEFAIDHKMHNKYIILTQQEIGNIYTEAGNKEKSLDILKKSLAEAKRIGSKEMVAAAYEALALSYTKFGMNREASLSKAKAVGIRDTLFSQRQFNVAKNKLFEYSQREDEAKTNLLNKRISYREKMIVAIAIIALLCVILTILLVLKNRKLHHAYLLLIEKSQTIGRMEEQRTCTTKCNNTNNQNLDATKTKPLATTHVTQFENLAERIAEVMGDAETTSDPKFDLNTLVSMVDSNTSYVSRCIKDTSGKNFKALLNEQRVKEACRKMSETDCANLTLQAIYESVGFRSASNFIKAFKDVMGMTPSTYLKLVREKKNVDEVG